MKSSNTFRLAATVLAATVFMSSAFACSLFSSKKAPAPSTQSQQQ